MRPTSKPPARKIDLVMAPRTSRVGATATHVASRAVEREVEKKAFGALVDYHRTFELMIIDPPYAALTWTIRGTANGAKVEAPGCSNFEFDEEGRVRRYWMYFNPADFAYRN